MTAKAMTPTGSIPDQTIIGIIGAAMGAVALWLANRLLGKAAFQTAINTGFRDLLEAVQKDRDDLRKELEAERIASATAHENLRGDIRNLMQTIKGLKRLLRDHGVNIPDDWHPDAKDAAKAQELDASKP